MFLRRSSSRSGRVHLFLLGILRTLEEKIQRTLSANLVDGAADLREHVACVRPDQTHRAYHNNKNDCQHHGILSDVLSFFI